MRTVLPLILIVAACGVPPSTPSYSYTAGNNQAVLSGVQLGTGATAHTELRKRIDVKLSGDARFSAGEGWALRTSSTSETTYLAIPITNTDSKPHCSVHASALLWRDAGGAVVFNAGEDYVMGSVGNLGTTAAPRLTSKCLGAGETGWLFDIQLANGAPLYSSVASLDVTLDSQPVVQSSAASLMPTQYALNGEAVRVSFTNEGTASATLASSFSRLVLLDGDGSPLGWHFVNRSPLPGDVFAEGASGTVDTAGALTGFPGAATRVQVLMDWDAPSSGSALRAAVGDGDAELQAAWRAAR